MDQYWPKFGINAHNLLEKKVQAGNNPSNLPRKSSPARRNGGGGYKYLGTNTSTNLTKYSHVNSVVKKVYEYKYLGTNTLPTLLGTQMSTQL